MTTRKRATAAKAEPTDVKPSAERVPKARTPGTKRVAASKPADAVEPLEVVASTSSADVVEPLEVVASTGSADSAAAELDQAAISGEVVESPQPARRPARVIDEPAAMIRGANVPGGLCVELITKAGTLSTQRVRVWDSLSQSASVTLNAYDVTLAFPYGHAERLPEAIANELLSWFLLLPEVPKNEIDGHALVVLKAACGPAFFKNVARFGAAGRG